MSLISPAIDSDLVLFEDEHLLVINKPPGINTHAPTPHASEGIYDWLRHHDPKWQSLAIHQRLDRETSGVLLFGRTRTANQSLAKQFENRSVEKCYHLLTDRPPGQLPCNVESTIGNLGGGRFGSVDGPDARPARTEFQLRRTDKGRWLIEAHPLTGRTHQIRIHARDAGFPILGDSVYGGTHSERLCLHAYSLKLKHPATNEPLELIAPIDFEWNPQLWLRQSLWPAPATNAWRLSHGASDGRSGFFVERLGDYLLSQSETDFAKEHALRISAWRTELKSLAHYHKNLDRHVRQSNPEKASPQYMSGETAPERFEIRENDVRYSMSFEEGYSVGLFLDQKDNRNRLLTGYLFPAAAPISLESKSVLNAFAYTCGFSVCAAKSGATVTSLDLSKKYLDWGRENFRLNDIDPEEHDFIFGDCFDWMKRLTKKGRQFDMVLLDPPTFSKSKRSGIFKADKDYGRLVTDALKLLAPGGVLFASTNCATLAPEDFLAIVRSAITEAGRKIGGEFYAPQPPDFPSGSTEPPYLKTVWLQID